MFLLKHFYRQAVEFGLRPKRLVYDEAPSPDIAEELTLDASMKKFERGKAGDAVPLDKHQFDDAKIKALNLLANVEASAGEKYKEQARALKEELASDIHKKFDALHQNYLTNIQERIYRVGEGSQANRLRAEERAKAQAIINDIQKRVHAGEVKERVQYEAGLKGLREAIKSKDKGRQIEAGSAVISNFLRLLKVPDKIRGLAKFMAKEMQENDELDDLVGKGSVKEALDWFRRVKLEGTDLIERAVKRLAQEIPQIKAVENETTGFNEKQVFKAILENRSLYPEYPGGLEGKFGGTYTDQAAEALALRFRVVDVNPAGDVDGQKHYYIDLKNPGTIYTKETLPEAVRAIVESDMKSGERGDVKRQFEEWKRKAEQLNQALFSVAEPDYLVGNRPFNDMIDSLSELQGENPSKLDQLAMLLKHAENTDRARVLPLDTKARETLRTGRVAETKKKAEQAERDRQVNAYVTARTELVGIQLVTGLEFVLKEKKFDTAKIGELDMIKIKKGAEVVARIETKLEAPHKPELKIFKDGKDVLTKKFEDMNALKNKLKAKNDAIGIYEEMIDNNIGKVNDLIKTKAIWYDAKGREDRLIGLDLYVQPIIDTRDKPIDHFYVEVPLRYKGEKGPQIGHIRIDFAEGTEPTAAVVLVDGTRMLEAGPVANVRAYLEGNHKEIVKKGREAIANKDAVNKVKDSIKLPEGLRVEVALEPTSYTNPESTLDLTVKNANKAEVGTIKINVVTRNVTASATVAEVKESITCNPNNIKNIFKFFNDKAAALKDAKPPVEEAAASAAPERAPLDKELEDVRPNLEGMLRAQFPTMFTEKALKNPAIQVAVDAILKYFQNNKVRLDLLKERRNFVPSRGEQAMILAEVEKAYGWEKLGEVDGAETDMILTLQRPGDQKTFGELVGSNALANNLSRQYEIGQGKEANAIIIFDGKKKTDVIRLEDLAPFITDPAERANFEKAINPDIKDEAALRQAREALNQSATDREAPLETVRQIQAALKTTEVQKLFSEMSFTEAAGAIFQIFQAISEALQSKPPDLKTLADTLKCLTEGKPRNPADVMTQNADRFERIIRDNAPDKAEKQPDYIKQLLEVHLDPGGGAGNAFFDKANAATSGITEAQELKDLALFRREAKPVIVNYFKEQFGVDNITKISKIKVDNIDRIKLEGDHNGARFDAEFYNKSGKYSADIYKFETVESSLRRKAVPEKTVEGVTFANLKEAITGVKTAEATAEDKTYGERYAQQNANNPAFEDYILDIQKEYAELPDKGGKTEWQYVDEKMSADPSLGEQYKLGQNEEDFA